MRTSLFMSCLRIMFASLLVFAVAASFALGCVLEILVFAAAASFALGCVLEILVFAAAASFALGCVLEILVFAVAAFSLVTLGFFTPTIEDAWQPEVLVAAASLVEDIDRALGIVSVVTNRYEAYFEAEPGRRKRNGG
jgi:hypothetical protein